MERIEKKVNGTIAEREREVRREIAKLDVDISDLVSATDDLMERLSFVARDEMPKVPPKETPVPNFNCQLATILNEYRERIVEVTARVVEASDRLEI